MTLMMCGSSGGCGVVLSGCKPATALLHSFQGFQPTCSADWGLTGARSPGLQRVCMWFVWCAHKCVVCMYVCVPFMYCMYICVSYS